MKVLELFAGIGAFSKALERLGIEHEIVDAVEIDKYAIRSFNAIHGTDFEPQDITKWDKDLECDIIMHGSPCQDFSVAGKQAGGDKDSGTRSSLMYETLRIVEKLKPKYVIWENVKNLLSKKHKHNFDAYQEAMRELGYRNYYQILNAKDYGVPQNRERVFTVSIRNDIEGDYIFPEKQPLEHRLKDILEDNVDERCYLSDEQVSKIKTSTFMTDRRRNQEKEYCDTLRARDWKDPKCVRVGGLYDKEGSKHQAGSIYDTNGICATLSTMQGGNQEPIIVASRGRGENNEQQLEPNLSGTTNTLTSVQKGNYVAEQRDISKTVRTGGRGSVDRHSWDIVVEPQIVDAKTTRGGDITSTIRASIHKQGSRNLLENIKNGRGYEGVAIKTANKKGFDMATDGDAIDLQYPDSKTRRGRVGHGVSKTPMTSDQMAVVTGYRIRKLTPLECWRLMGFDDADFRKAEQVNSNTQLYKQAGNSIVVNCLEEIIKGMEWNQPTDQS